jgi:kynurenine formamidase
MTTREDVLAIAADVSNWGRWGPRDEKGTLNLITPAVRAAAAGLVRHGHRISLALPLDEHGPARPNGNRGNPRHEMTATGDGVLPAREAKFGARYSDDMVHMYLQCATQWDALSHVFYDGFIYNGVPADSVSVNGAKFAAITVACSEFVSRGVLLDVARARGVDWLGPADTIGGKELSDIADTQNVELRSGDIVLIRTGLMASWHATGQWATLWNAQPGVDLSVARWLHANDSAALAADNSAVERLIGDHSIPFHMLALRDMGMCLGELWDLEELARDCAADGRYDFLLCAAGLPITGAVGSPVNPIAIK